MGEINCCFEISGDGELVSEDELASIEERACRVRGRVEMNNITEIQMSEPVDHKILDDIFKGLTNWEIGNHLSRESECLEFYDYEHSQWFEVVVRPIDEPSNDDITESLSTKGGDSNEMA